MMAGSQQQLTLDEFTDTERCAAIAESTSERCRRRALRGVPYCPYHLDTLAHDDSPLSNLPE